MIPEPIVSDTHDATSDADESVTDALVERDKAGAAVAEKAIDYQLDAQVGYLLRLANQRHLEIFNTELPDLTPTQLALLARLLEHDDISQNELGRRVGIDAATTNGVIDRLSRKKLVRTRTDEKDKRRLRICLTGAGRQAIREAIPVARRITQLTLQPLSAKEAGQLIRLLQKLQLQPC